MAVIGIDLGTTNSLAVAFVQDHYEMIPNSFQEFLTPSVVSIDDDGSIIVGKAARQRLITHSQNTTSLFKRNMGKQKTVMLQNHRYLPEELSAFVVKQLVEDAKAYLMEDIDEIVISVPAYFSEAQRQATKKIGNILGIKIDRLINEPSAASLSCHQDCTEDETFIVFDFGGGTLDVSVVDCFDNVVSICAIAGNNHLGGSDFDQLIAYDFCAKHDIVFKTLSTKQKESLLMQCENAKIRLQNNNETMVHIHMDGTDYDYKLSNNSLQSIGAPIFSKMKTVIAEAVNCSGFHKGEIDKMVLVGGSCHMPVVVSFLSELMNIQIHEVVDMDHMVAKGLGTYIGIKQRKEAVKQLVLTDICPFSLSTGVHNDTNPMRDLSSVLIKKNTVLPTSVTREFATAEKGQTAIAIRIYQGESIYADENMELASYEIQVPKDNMRHERFEVTFSYDINSLLCVDVVTSSTKERQRFFVGDYTYSDESVNAIRNASMKLTLEPDIQLISEQIDRIMEESAPDKQDYVRELYIDFMKLMDSNVNNLRKRAKLIQHMKEIVRQLDDDNQRSDFFFYEEDEEEDDMTEGFLS